MKVWWVGIACLLLFFSACTPVVSEKVKENKAEPKRESISEPTPEPTSEPSPEPTRDPSEPVCDTPSCLDASVPEGWPEPQPEPQPELTPDIAPSASCKQEIFDWEGRKRLYILCTPSKRPSTPMPVVFGFHGGGGNALNWKSTMPLHELGAKEGFVTVFMQGCNDLLKDCAQKGKYIWNIGKKGVTRKVDDQSYTKEVLRRLTAVHKLSINNKRLFATGHSMGGMFSYSLRCDHPALFAAIGPLSAPPTDATCNPQSPTAIFHVHGSKDVNVPFAGGCCSRDQKTPGNAAYLKGCDSLPRCFNPSNWWPPVRNGKHPYGDVTGLDEMASKSFGCDPGLREISRKGNVLCYEYRNCKKQKQVGVCLLVGVDHSLGAMNRSLNLPNWLWARFKSIP